MQAGSACPLDATQFKVFCASPHCPTTTPRPLTTSPSDRGAHTQCSMRVIASMTPVGAKIQQCSESNWIFAPTGVIEAMTRIEHCVWAPRSEGDVVRGLGVVVGQCGDAQNTFNWIASNGQADPACIPWPFPAARNDGYWVPG